MNASAQRISIKSLDMQRQNIAAKKFGRGRASPYLANQSASTAITDKNSFNQVVGMVTNPFQKSNLNFAVKQ